ncbi:MAG: hypothetical protein PHX61_08970 [Alphaproteobacteria bacterium]|nr:hypothetical protein [Alphaproteobacteria bacterium]
MKLQTFIKENRILVAGITLPLLLVALLAYAKTLPAKNVPDPQYRAAYSDQVWSGMGNIDFDVDKDGRLGATFRKNSTPYQDATPPKAKIYIYDFKTNSNMEFDIKISDEDAKKDIATISIPDLEHYAFSNDTAAPDGYVFEPYYYRRNSSLITDIFISNSRYYGPTIHKDARIIELPRTPNQYSGNLKFVGWVTNDKQ